VLHASREPREIPPWPSLARIERAPTLHRRSVIRIVRDLEEHGLIDARLHHFAARKASAT
jgi:hypothetical protein